MKKKRAIETFEFLTKNVAPPLRQLNAISSQTPHQSGQKMPVFPQTSSGFCEIRRKKLRTGIEPALMA